MSLDGHTSDLNHNHLDYECENDHTHEKAVSEHSRENIEFSFFELSSVDLVEKLKEDENLEDQGIVEKLLSLIPLLKVVWSIHVGWISDDCICAFSFEAVLFLVFFADHLVKSSFIEVFGFESLSSPPLKSVSILVKRVSVERIPFKAGNIVVTIFVTFYPVVGAQPSWGSKDNKDKSKDLVDGMSENISPHYWGNYSIIFLVWLSL